MLSHDKQGYPTDWTAEAEYEPKHQQHGKGMLRDLEIIPNPAVTEDEFQQMIQRASLDDETKSTLARTANMRNIQGRTYQSYWNLGGLVDADCYGPMLKFQIKDLRRLIDPKFSHAQGLHHTEL
jgi:hypothetical protein